VDRIQWIRAYTPTARIATINTGIYPELVLALALLDTKASFRIGKDDTKVINIIVKELTAEKYKDQGILEAFSAENQAKIIVAVDYGSDPLYFELLKSIIQNIRKFIPPTTIAL
jgi:flagellum-specific peptidoglycan hydrolase FlgJ